MSETEVVETARPVSRKETLSFVVILALAALLRLYGLGNKSFWVDEIFAVERSHSLRQAVAYCWWNHEPPLRYFLVHYLMRLHPPELATRLPSFLFGVATIGLLWHLVRHLFGVRAALVAAFLLAVSPWHIEQCQDARMYAVMMFLWTLSLVLFFGALENPGQPLWWPALAIVHGVNFNLSYLTVFVLGAEALTFVGWLAVRKWREGNRFALKPYALGALIFAGFFGPCVAFWFDPLLDVFGRYTGVRAVGVSAATRAMNAFVRVEWPAEFGMPFFISLLDRLLAAEMAWRILALVGLSAGLVLCWRKSPVFVWIAALSFLLALVAIRFTSMRHFVAPRYVFHLLLFSIVASAVAMVALADAILSWAGPAKRRQAMVGLAVASAAAMALYAPILIRQLRGERQDWRSACRFLAENAKRDDLILTGPWGTDQAVRYYGRPVLTEHHKIKNVLTSDAPYREIQNAAPGTTVWYVIWGYMPEDLLLALATAMTRAAELPGTAGAISIYRGSGRKEAPAAEKRSGK